MTKYENIPAELRALPQWVCFRDVSPDSPEYARSKGPIDPHVTDRAKNASVSDPATWATFEEAVSACETGGFGGVGFVLTEDDPYLCIDLDHVIDGGEVDPEALGIVEAVGSYTELSPSGTGLHVWCQATKPGQRSRAGIVEMYESGRYIRFTGDVYEGRNVLRNAQKAVQALYSQYLDTDTGKDKNGPQRASQSFVDVPADVQTVIERAERSRNGERFAALFSGDTTGYTSRSEADLALCSMAAFFSGGDAALTDAVFRQSGLMRDKWDELRGEQTYGEMTVSKALEQGGFYGDGQGYSEVSTPGRDGATASAYRDPEESTDGDQTDRPSSESYQHLPDIRPISEYMEEGFFSDLERFGAYKPKETGFRKLDTASRGLYPGLYVLGALSSLGKTTFALNVADHLATNGTPVLFFSLEQSRFELFSKIVAKRTYDGLTKTGVDALSIRLGSVDERVRRAVERAYDECAPNLTIAECSFDADVTTIAASVARFIEQRGEKPVVFVDYLQIMRSTDPHLSDKQAVDQNVHALKKLQADLDLTLFVVSSVNRANYLTPMSFESFKESGSIEYTADVVWGLQFACLSEELFSKKDSFIKEKRQRINEARAESPRSIELVCLKNRYGKAFYTVPFHYIPECDLFREV